jgi:hypothetical protein
MVIPLLATPFKTLTGIDLEEQPQQGIIKSYQANDMMLFKSYPRSISPAITSEAIYISYLFPIQEDIAKLEHRAKRMETSVTLPLAKAQI